MAVRFDTSKRLPASLLTDTSHIRQEVMNLDELWVRCAEASN